MLYKLLHGQHIISVAITAIIIYTAEAMLVKLH